jgi:hypothetical protein
MRRLLTLLLVTAFALVFALPGATAAARPPEPTRGRPLLLALGDSVTAGEGSHVDRSQWPTTGYVALLTEKLREELGCLPAASPDARVFCPGLTIENLGRPAGPLPGVTAAAVISEQLGTAVSLLEERNGNANPRDDVEVVTLSVGGNELYDTAGRYCLGPEGPGADCFPQIGQLFTTYAGQLGEILAKLRAAGGPELRIVVMTYYNSLPLPACGMSDAGALGDLVLEGGPTGPGFNDIIRVVAGSHGATTAEVFGRLDADDFVDCKHPSPSGHAIIADAFREALLP